MSQLQPFVRWAGGKRALASQIIGSFPSDFDPKKNRYFEPFVGGGAVMLALSERVPGSRVVINDVNPDLVATYDVIAKNTDELIAALTQLAADTSQTAFEKVRAQRPTACVERAARFVYLNKLCFNGLWRVNSKGEFNVPYGHLKNPNVVDAPLLRAVSARLQGASIRCGSYASALADTKPGDIVYMDPPYVPLQPNSFSKYAKDDFSMLDQYALAGVIRGLTERGVRVILSNSDTPTTRAIFGGELELRQLSVARSIGASGATRKRVDEVLGFNYTPQGTAGQLTQLCSYTGTHTPSLVPSPSTGGGKGGST